MVLSVIRNIDSISNNKILICDDIDFEVSHSIFKSLLDHVLFVSELFEKEKYGLSVYELNVLSNLPQIFKRNVAIDVGKELDIKTRTMDNYLKKWKLKGVRTGCYDKQIS